MVRTRAVTHRSTPGDSSCERKSGLGYNLYEQVFPRNGEVVYSGFPCVCLGE